EAGAQCRPGRGELRSSVERGDLATCPTTDAGHRSEGVDQRHDRLDLAAHVAQQCIGLGGFIARSANRRRDTVRDSRSSIFGREQMLLRLETSLAQAPQPPARRHAERNDANTQCAEATVHQYAPRPSTTAPNVRAMMSASSSNE